MHLEYHGKSDFSDALALSTARPGIELDARVRVPEMQRWLAEDAASPLPPLQATLKAPSLEFEGVRMEQFARDARITTIYEGTTGIQAMDLLGRKIIQLQGAGMEGALVARTGGDTTLDSCHFLSPQA